MADENQNLENYDNDPFAINEMDLEIEDTQDLTQEANIFQDLEVSDVDPTPQNTNEVSNDFDFEGNDNNEEEDDNEEFQGKDIEDALFGDDDVDKDDLGEEDSKKEIEDHIKKLESLNYKVVKPGENPDSPEVEEFSQEKEVLKTNANFIRDAVDFIKQSDEAVVRAKIQNDVIERFRKEGTNYTTADIETEVEDLLQEYSPSVLKSYAETLRSQVHNSALEKKRESETVQKRINDSVQERQNEIKRKTQSAFKDIRKSQFFGIELSDSDIRQAYKNLTTGEVARKLEDDPKLAAEVALFQIKKDEFSSKLGGPTYGEGVRNAVKTILGEDVTKPSTQSVIDKNAKRGSNESSRVEAWLPKSSKNKDDKTNGRDIWGI